MQPRCSCWEGVPPDTLNFAHQEGASPPTTPETKHRDTTKRSELTFLVLSLELIDEMVDETVVKVLTT